MNNTELYIKNAELERYMNEKLAIGKKAKKEQERLKKADIEEMIMDVYVYIFFS